MPAPQYKIVFDGLLQPGYALETVKHNLATLFKTDPETVDKLFSGQTVSLKRDLSKTAAQKYLQALQEAGADARIEEEPETQLSLALPLEPIPEPERSPYAAPAAPLDTRTHPGYYGELRVFSFKGRIARLRYLAWSLVCMLAVGVGAIVMSLASLGAHGLFHSLVLLVGSVTLAIISLQIAVRRLHDLGWSGWLVLLQFVPGINTLFLLGLAVIPGNRDANRYGAPPPPNTRAVKIIAALWLLFLVAVLAVAAMGGFSRGLGTSS